jgi:hypothetical protein
MLTPDEQKQIEAIRQREQAASRGPCRVDYDGPSRPIIITGDGSFLRLDKYEDRQWGWYEGEDADSLWFAHSFQDILFLLKIIDRLQAELEKREKGVEISEANFSHAEPVGDYHEESLYECPNGDCLNDCIEEGDSYCSHCGTKLNWKEGE